MPPVLTNPTPGATMVWLTDIEAQFDAVRTWLNSIPLGDIAAGAIAREHLVRPVVRGFPMDGLYSGFQGIYRQPFGISSPDALAREEWGGKPDRTVIIPAVHDGVDEVFRTRHGRTFYAPPGGGDVSVVCSFDCWIRSPVHTIFGAGDLVYPDGAGGPGTGVPARAGYFALHFYERSSSTETVSAHTRDIYPLVFSSGGSGNVFGPFHDKVVMFANEDLGEGDCDVQLVYHRDTANANVHQVDISRVQFQVEVL